MIDWSTCPAVESVPGKVSGNWVFTGTRLSVYTLFENLESGATVEEFMDWFHPVDEWKVRASISACGRLIESIRSEGQHWKSGLTAPPQHRRHQQQLDDTTTS